MGSKQPKIFGRSNNAWRARARERFDSNKFGRRSIVINNNKLKHDNFNEKWEKEGKHANDAGGTVTKIKELIETASFEIKFRLITKLENKECQFNRDLMKHLTKDCDDKARKTLETINSQSEESNMEKVGKNAQQWTTKWWMCLWER